MNDPTNVNLNERVPNQEKKQFNIEDIYAINTEEVLLPSKGQFYKNHKDRVTMKGYTTIEENMMTDESLSRSGKLLDKLLQSVVMDQDLDWDNLMISDKLALIIAMRKQNEGSIFKSSVVCPYCQVNQSVDIDLKDVKMQELGAEPIDNGNLFEFTTPQGHSIQFRFLINSDLKSAKEEQKADERDHIKLDGGENIYLMMREIVGFKPSGHSEFIISRNQIKQIIQRMPKDELKAYREYVNKIEPRLKASFSFKCITPNCDANNNPLELPIPLNSISFFRPIR